MSLHAARLATSGRRPLRLALGLVAATAVVGCGSPPPLERLSEVQRDQLDAAWTARISATDTADLGPDARNERAKALYAACKPLDPGNPLLAAVAALCGPTASRQKLDVLLPSRCARPAAICVRALDRIAAATEQEGQQLEKVAAAVKPLVTDPKCLAQLTTSTVQIAGYGRLASAYRVVALGVEQDQADIADLGRRKVADAEAEIAPKGTIAQRTASFRADCLQQG